VMSWVLEVASWQGCFELGAGILALVAAQFYLFQRDRPEDVGLPPINSSEAPVKADGGKLDRAAWINLLLVGGFYFCAKLVRYAVWSWSAYLLHHNFGMSDSASNRYAIIFDLCGIPGIYLSGWISDRFFGSRRAGVALAMMIAMVGCTALLIAFGTRDVTTFIVLLGAVGFTLFGPDALLSGAGAMDIGGRAATFATAMIAGFGALGPIVQEVVIPRLYDQKAARAAGDLGPVFGVLFGAALLGTLFCAALVWRNARGGRGI
jgi:sugar phosphate permease